MIYGRSGQPVTIVRMAVLSDVSKFDQRKPGTTDRQAIKSGSYVIVDDNGTERLYHQAFLRADNGSLEIATVLKALSTPK